MLTSSKANFYLQSEASKSKYAISKSLPFLKNCLNKPNDQKLSLKKCC